jgi:hypothetical protein
MTTSDKRLAAGYYNARYDLLFALLCMSTSLAVVLTVVWLAPPAEVLKTRGGFDSTSEWMILALALSISCGLIGFLRYARMSSVMTFFVAFDPKWTKFVEDDLLIPTIFRPATREELAKLRAGMRTRYKEMKDCLFVSLVVDTLWFGEAFFMIGTERASFARALLCMGLYLATFGGMIFVLVAFSGVVPPLPIPALTWPDEEEEEAAKKKEEGKKEK